MAHVRLISRGKMPVAHGATDVYETIILLLVSIFFNDWDNFASVIQNLQKYYSKTP